MRKLLLLLVLILLFGCQSPQRPTFEERCRANKLKVLRYLYDVSRHTKKVEEYLEKEQNPK